MEYKITYSQILVVDMRCIRRCARVCRIIVEIANFQSENAIHFNFVMTFDKLTFLV